MTVSWRSMRCFVLIWFLCGIPWSVLAQTQTDLPVRSGWRVETFEQLNGRFKMEKVIDGFSRRMVSSGRFELDSRLKVVNWKTEKPFVSTSVFSREVLQTLDAQGNVVQRIDVAKEPSIALFNGLLFDLLSGQLESLVTVFELTELPELDGHWRMRLRPLKQETAQWIAEIELAGNKRVEVVRYREAAGATTKIELFEEREAK